MTDNELFMAVLNKNVEDYGISYEWPEEGNTNLVSVFYKENLLGTLNLDGKTLAYNLNVLNDLMDSVFEDIDKKNGVNDESYDEKSTDDVNVVDASFTDSTESSKSTNADDSNSVEEKTVAVENTSTKE